MYRLIVTGMLLFLCVVTVDAASLPCSGSPRQVAATYRAGDGARLEACFDLDRNTVTVGLADGNRVVLPAALSGSGARYSDGARTFWEHQGVGRYFVGEKLLFEGGPAPAAGYKSGVTSKLLTQTGVTADGRKIVYPVTTNPEVTAMLVEIAPKAETGWHKHDVPVYAYMLGGELEVLLEGGRKLTYKTGDAIIEVVGTMHNGINKGNEAARLVVFYTGSKGQPNVIRKQE
jgi:quercetin dioxygenase-like cupin family protein/membrane-bound inhibitor of C-type lysozyme